MWPIVINVLNVGVFTLLLTGGFAMPFKFNDLMITVLPRMRPHDPGCDDTSGGCNGTTTTSLCGGEGGRPVECQDSGETIEIPPISFVDPAYQMELRQLILYGLAQSRVGVPHPIKLDVLEKQMRPQTIQEIELLEVKLQDALKELKERKAGMLKK